MRTHWKTIVTLLGIALPALGTYLAARAESNEAKIRAEIAYTTMQNVVQDLQEASYKQALQLAELKGQLRTVRWNSHEETAPVKLTPPVDLNQAVEQYKAKK